MPIIESLSGLEILDSRGSPTVSATCRLSGGAVASASIPSGASTGAAEACELRDGDLKRYRGKGCRKAVDRINNEVNAGLRGRSFDQQELDRAMLDLDGTPNQSRLGANAILAVSLAFARAAAAEAGQPLYQHFASMLGQAARTLPRPTINLFSGGRHAGRQVAIQDVLLVPAANSMDECLSTAFDIYHAAAEMVQRQFGMRLLRADEGGLAPPFRTSEAMLDAAVSAIQAAGYTPGRDICLAVDVAATHFHRAARYDLDGEQLSAPGMIQRLVAWLGQYPIVSLEDGLAEDDWDHWPLLREAVHGRSRVLGDDLLCTNPARIRRAVDAKAADALLLKVNQIGTLTEALDAYRLARAAGWAVTISARSGETEDDWLADLAVGWSADQIKIGSVTQSDRLAKYNRLLAIESETHLCLAP